MALAAPWLVIGTAYDKNYQPKPEVTITAGKTDDAYNVVTTTTDSEGKYILNVQDVVSNSDDLLVVASKSEFESVSDTSESVDISVYGATIDFNFTTFNVDSYNVDVLEYSEGTKGSVSMKVQVALSDVDNLKNSMKHTDNISVIDKPFGGFVVRDATTDDKSSIVRFVPNTYAQGVDEEIVLHVTGYTISSDRKSVV